MFSCINHVRVKHYTKTHKLYNILIKKILISEYKYIICGLCYIHGVYMCMYIHYMWILFINL